MKKYLHKTLFAWLVLSASLSLPAQYEMIFVGKANNPIDSMMRDYFYLEGYNVNYVEESEFKTDGGLFSTAAGYEGFDVIVVSESIGSTSANNYRIAGFPIPCVVTEGYVAKTDRWGLLADDSDTYFKQASSANLTADVLTLVITDNEHWITREYDQGAHIIWANADDPTKLGVTGFLLGDDIEGAEPLAEFLFDMGGFPGMWAIPDGSILHGTTTLPNMVLIGVIQTDVGQVFTYEFLDLVRRSVQWVTNDYEAESVRSTDQYQVRIGPNPTKDLVDVSLNMPDPGKVTVHIYDIAGKLVESTGPEILNAGYNRIQLDLSNLSQAQYMYEIITEKDILRGKISKY